jgi:NADH dehydrogenase (ubiquinone) Fe-S protein 4
MGWGSTADYMQGTSMRFRTREAAIHFAEKQGWSYQVDKVQEARIPPKSYG